MICPYICHVIQTNQNRYEYDEEGWPAPTGRRS